MKYAKLGNLGNTEIEVSKLCVGCMSFGKPFKDFHEWTLSQNETDDVVRHALEFEPADEDAAYLEELYVPRNIADALPNEK